MGKNKYEILLLDVPWTYNRDDLGNDPAMGGITYSVLKDTDLYQLPIQNICEKNCLCFLWATLPKLPEAIQCLKHWGFTYSTVAFVWIKLNPTGFLTHTMGKYIYGEKEKTYHITEVWGGFYSGIGRWTNSNVEVVLLGKKGSIPRQDKSVKQLLLAPRKRHSEKPRDIYGRIDRLVGDRKKIELFARTKAPDPWDSTGLELDGVDIRDFLAS